MSSIPVANFASCLGKYDTTIQGSVVSDSADYAGTGDISFNGGYILNTTAFVLPAPVTGNGISFSGWFYPTGVEATNTALFDVSCTPAATTSHIAVYFTGTNALSMTYNGTSASTSSNVYNTNAWNFFMYTVCCSGNIAVQNLYVNTIGTGANPATLTNSAGTYTQYTVNSTFLGFGVGSTFGLTKYVGRMDDFRFYSRVITPMEYRVLQGSNYGNTSMSALTPSFGTNPTGPTAVVNAAGSGVSFTLSSSGTFAYFQVTRTLNNVTTSMIVSASSLTLNNGTYTYIDSGLTTSVSYSYIFTPYSMATSGTPSGVSNILTATTAITALSSLAASSISYTGFTSTWTGGVGVSAVVAYTITGIGSVTPSSSGTGTATFTGLSQLTSWPLTVSYTNGYSTASASLTVLAPPTAITSISASSITLTSFIASWVGGVGLNIVYTYTINSSSSGFSTSGTNPTTFTGLTGNAWSLVVTETNTAFNGTGGSVSSSTFYILASPSPISSVTPSSITTTGFVVNWSTDSDLNVVYSYTINGSGTGFSTSGNNPTTFTGLTGTSWLLVITEDNRAYNATGGVVSSAGVTIYARPSAITGITFSAWTASSFNVSWSGGVAANTVTFTFAVTGSTPTITNLTATSATISNLTATASWPLTITATNTSGNTSTSATTYAIPTAITSLASSSVNSSGFITTWSGGTSSLAVTYSYTINGSATGFSTSGTNPTTFSGLTGVTWAMVVTATNSSGNVTGSLTVYYLPTPITGITFSSWTTSSFNVSWSGGTGGTVTYTFAVTGSTPTVTNLTTTSATLSNLSATSSWPLTITATNAGGSVNSSATTYAPPTAITGLTSSSITATGFVASWSGSTSGTTVTYSYTINGLASGFSTSGTNPTTFSGLTGTTWTLVVTATNTSGNVTGNLTVYSFPFVINPTITNWQGSDQTGTSVYNGITYKVYSFLSTSVTYTLTYTCNISSYIYVLAVGGGGSGACSGSNGQGGGGGGGGVVMMPVLLPAGTNQTITINVGAGAPSLAQGVAVDKAGLNGSNSTVQFSSNSSLNIYAWGGGGGGSNTGNAGSGGSGGGPTGNYYQGTYNTFTPGRSNNTYNNFGNSGTSFINPNPLSQAYWSCNFALGGGGAGLSVPPISFANTSMFCSPGGYIYSTNNYQFSIGPNYSLINSGGAGIQCSLPGISTFSPLGTMLGSYYWGGGGGAGTWYNPNGKSGNGGLGGGGGGGQYNGTATSGGAGFNNGSNGNLSNGFGGAGGANTGGGGGGSYFTAGNAPTAAGGSGIVVISFPQTAITNNINAVLPPALASSGAYNTILNSISTSAASSIRAAFSCKLINYNYFGPIFTLRCPMDMYGFYAQNFYADVCGNLGIGYLGTGQSLKNWLLSWGTGGGNNTNYAYVVKWYDQGMDICFNSAIQYTWGNQPIYDLSTGCVNFGYTGSSGGSTSAPQIDCYLNLPQGALPSGNASYTYTTNLGYAAQYTVGQPSNVYSSVITGGTGVSARAYTLTLINSNITSDWYGTGTVSLTNAWNSSTNRLAITSQYASGTGTIFLNNTGSTPNITTNGLGTRNQDTCNNVIGANISWANGGYNGQMYNMFVFDSVISNSDRLIIESTPYTYSSVPAISGVQATSITTTNFVLSWTAVTNAQSYALWTNNIYYGIITNGSTITPSASNVSNVWTTTLYAYDANNKLIASSTNGVIVGGITVSGYFTTPTISTYNAILFNGNSTIISQTSITVQLLMVGGGGGGGNILTGTLNSSSGGGGGGVAAGSITLSANTLYTITVGAGGSGGISGGFTSITGSDINIKVYGGGAGGNYNSNGSNGGSGGGGAYVVGTAITGTNTGTNTGSITFNGYAGGLVINPGRVIGGGGGGAGGVGLSGNGTGSTGDFNGGYGGGGYTWSVTGDVYAGGGGGGCGFNQIVLPYTNFPGIGGSGGGGLGGGYYPFSTTGTNGIMYDSVGGNATYYGGGGGGASQANSSWTILSGGNGYQGCVIMAFR